MLIIKQVKFLTMHETSQSTYIVHTSYILGRTYAYLTGTAEVPKNRGGHYDNRSSILVSVIFSVSEKMGGMGGTCHRPD